LRQSERLGDIPILISFIATAKQNGNRFTAPDEIDTITVIVVDPHLRYTATHRLYVARVSEREAADANSDAGAGLAIPQPNRQKRQSAGLRS